MTPTNFAIQLLASDPMAPEQLAGRLEHVLSGQRIEFASGSELLAQLARLRGPQPGQVHSKSPTQPKETP